MLRRIKELGGSEQDLLDVFIIQIRCLCELACPAWNGSLTKTDIKKIENIQKSALKIILNTRYSGYKNALDFFKIQSLEERRKSLSTSFAKKSRMNPKFKVWFKRPVKVTRHKVPVVLPKTRTASYMKSPLFYLANLINSL